MSRHALEVLEFERVLERIAGRAASEVGRRRILGLRPLGDRECVARELGRVDAVMRFMEEAPDWGMPPVPDVGPALDRLGVEGSVLEPLEIHALGQLLGSSRRLLGDLQGREGRLPELESVRVLLLERRPLEQAIERCVDGDGHVLDSASRDLKQIRSRLRGAHARIVKRLEAYLSSLPERIHVPDGSVSIRDGRYVLPVRREGRREVGGIVHDESQTGATLFIEPPVAIELMNEVRDLERDEAREIRRILGDLTTRLAGEHAPLEGAVGALGDFDALHARARMAFSWGGVVPEMVEARDSQMIIHQGRHPLLLQGDGPPVVPFDLSLEPRERALVVSGPNTGGKSVFLKATGLIAALAQSGIVPPVAKGTRLPVFRTFYADIGDEQSIARSLSTFSAHLVNLSEIVASADGDSLVLVDEMGTGTDPAEGAALARAVLEALVERGARALVSSHLGELKRLDTEGSGIVNASLQFDSERMEPTYRLMKGLPGRSYGLAVARRLGFPGAVLDSAEAYRSDDDARMDEVLQRLELRERDAERLVHELAAERAETARLRDELEDRARALREAERSADARARENARKMLLEARGEVEAAVDDLRRAADEGADVDGAIHDARRRVEQAAARQRDGDREIARAVPLLTPVAGDRVRIRATGAKGRVVDVRAGRAHVEVGAVRMEIPVEDLESVEGGAPGSDERRSVGSWRGPATEQARLEVDLRGIRVYELDVELVRALDHAVLEDLPELRIIHGKGTGALRKRVGELLRDDARVMEVRPGGPTEGGTGVTVASFRGGGE